MAKLKIDLQSGLLELEGDDKFVERVYADLKDVAFERLSQSTFDDGAAGEKQNDLKKEPSATQSKGRRRKSGAPSCAGRIEALKADDFFKSLRSAGEVREKLTERGSTYPSKNIAAALNNLIESGKLRRLKEDGNWKYQNP